MTLAIGLLIAMVGVLIAGLASVVGIWMERDASRPKHWAFSLTALILLTTVVSMYQSYDDAIASEKMEEDLARMLARLDKIASESDVEIPGLNSLLAKEIEAQSRSNPNVVSKMTDRVTADGGDAQAMLGRHLPPSEMNSIGAVARGDAKSSGSRPSDKVKIAKLEKQIASFQADQNKESDAEKKLKQELEQLRAESKQAMAAQAAQQDTWKSELEKLKDENEKLEEKLKKTKKNNSNNALWSTKG